jgi:NAD+ diphosphatase
VTVEPPALARVSYDRAARHRRDSSWLAEAWKSARVVLVDPQGRSPVRRGEGLLRLSYAVPAEVDPSSPRRLLGLVDGVAYFSATVPGDDSWAGLREIGAAADDLEAGLLASAVALELWHGRHTHCPRCGTPTAESLAGWTRTCPADASEHFPRTDPAVIMVVHDGADRCLLGRGAAWGPGRFSTLAGFVEPGESLESTVAREVFEETAIRVTDARYVASQPWPFPASIMLGFVARLDGDPTIHVDGDEVVEADWFTRAEVARAAHWADGFGTPDPHAILRGVSPKLSISRYLIDRWLADDLPV